MELIRDAIEWVGNEAGAFIFTIGPYLLVGLVGLYVLWLVIGYLRVSQVGLGEARGQQPAVPLPAVAGGGAEPPRGAPYCSFDGLQYPIGARFCSACERDLQYDCTNCGATSPASEPSCYRCGTPIGARQDPLIS
ncbi:MAG TPA: zinc ribbon domain-containing protein [Candidatus Limnocylindria bacterium]